MLLCRPQAVSAADFLVALTAVMHTGGETKAEHIGPASVHEASTKAVGHRGLTTVCARAASIAVIEYLRGVLVVVGCRLSAGSTLGTADGGIARDE